MLIQKLRLQRGWSQEQLSDLSGLSVRTIQRIERGQTPSVESLKSIAAVFEVDFSILREPQMETVLNTPEPNTRADEALALAHVRKLKGLYIYVVRYTLIIFVLAIINLTTFPRYLWVGWVALAWGIGLLFHALQVFDKVPFLSGKWERAQVEKQLGRKL